MVNGKDYFVVRPSSQPGRDPNNPTAKGVIRYYGEYRVLAHHVSACIYHLWRGGSPPARRIPRTVETRPLPPIPQRTRPVGFSQIDGIRNDTESEQQPVQAANPQQGVIAASASSASGLRCSATSSWATSRRASPTCDAPGR